MNDREFFDCPALSWPMWPLLPMKRRGADIFAKGSLGFMIDNEKYEYTVFIGSMFDQADPNNVVKYKDLDSLLAEWVVD